MPGLSNKQFFVLLAITLVLAIAATFFSANKSGHPYYAELQDAHHAMMHSDMPHAEGRKTIAVLLYDGFTPMDAFGPMASLTTLADYQIVTVAKTKEPIAAEGGTKLVADHTLDEVKSADVLIVPGGTFGTVAAVKDQQLLSWIQQIDKTTTYTSSVCTGAWMLAASGLLKDKLASTHWSGKKQLEQLGARYSDKRYTVDGKYITSAGMSAGIDMGLALTAMLKGEDAAKTAQLMMEYDPRPPYQSGSPKKADDQLLNIVQTMYDDHVQMAGGL